jgi:formylglycine-generating enzyme required for sulfatase activity
MKRILGIAVVLGLMGALSVMAQEVKPGKTGVINLGNDVKLEMLLIPAGKLLMGVKKIPVDPFSNIKVKQPQENEVPQHEVTLTKPYFMGKYEVTQEQWFEIMGENPSENKGRKLPVTDVSWEDCQEFIKKLNENTKGGYRLPTEAEWEYACRAETTTAYSFGDEITPKDANYRDSTIGKPVAVGSYKSNAFGLYDMHGNVWEWCEDWHAKYPAGAVTDPKGPATGISRVLRGGSFYVNESNARSSYRNDYTPTDRFDGLGFRLARTK